MNKTLITMPNTIKHVLLCCCIVISSILIAQQNSHNKQLDSLATIMFNATNNKDFNVLLNHTYPKLFELLPRKQMVEVLKMTFEGNDDFKVDIPKLEPKYLLSKIFKDENDNVDFAFISYDLPMQMTFKNQAFDNKGKQMLINMMKAQGMEANFISNQKLSVIKKNSLTIFIKDEVTNGTWKMINYDTNSPLFFDILPASILKKAKDYYENLMIASKSKQ